MGEVDNVCTVGYFGGGCVRNILDAIAAEDDDLVVARSVGLAIDECAGADDGKRMQHRTAVVFLSAATNHNRKQDNPPTCFHSHAPPIWDETVKRSSAFYA